MLVTAATDLQKDIVEGGRVSRWGTGSWLSQLKMEQKPQLRVICLYALPVGGSHCYGILCQKFSLDRRAHLCF